MGRARDERWHARVAGNAEHPPQRLVCRGIEVAKYAALASEEMSHALELACGGESRAPRTGWRRYDEHICCIR